MEIGTKFRKGEGRLLQNEGRRVKEFRAGDGRLLQRERREKRDKYHVQGKGKGRLKQSQGERR